jgi:predicted CoA-binding protein
VTAEVTAYAPADDELRAILEEVSTIAVVGLSSNPQRHSYNVAEYLKQVGYQIVPVNPNETEVLGERAYPSLVDLPDRVDLVDVFRQPKHTPEVARQAVAIGAKVLWLQLGIVNEDAKRIAEAGGLWVIMGLCLMIEHDRLQP